MMTEKDELEQFLRHIVSQDREKDRTADKIAQQENEPDAPQKGASGSFLLTAKTDVKQLQRERYIQIAGQPAVPISFCPKICTKRAE